MTLIANALAPFQPVVAAFVNPASICSIWSLGSALLIAFVWLAARRRGRGRALRTKTLIRALFRRRVLFHRSTKADLAYCFVSLMAFGAILGWAVLSTAWIGNAVAGFLVGHFGERQTHASSLALDTIRTLVLFLAYDLGFFIDHTLKHRVPALWELHKTHHSAETLTPLVNFRVHPLDSLMLANMLALFIGTASGVATFALGRNAQSISLFDDNILMLLYIYLTAQLQHTQIWIPFTGIWGRIFLSPAHHQLHHSADAAHFNCNMGASLAVWDWFAGSLFVPPAKPPRLSYGASGFAHDPHGPMGLIVEPALKFASAVVRAFAAKAAGSLESARASKPADP